MSKWLRTTVLALVIVLALAVVAHATTWVFWVGAPNANNPSNGASATWGNYWDGVLLLYSTQQVKWQMLEPGWVVAVSDTTWVYGSSWGSQNNGTWVALSSAYTLNGYVYQGVVGAYANVGIGTNYAFSSGYQYFVAVAEYNLRSGTCGQLYFHADVYNSASTTATFYGVYIIANITWAYVTFFSENVSSNSWFNPAVPGPNACFSPGYYMYVATIAVNTTEYTVGTVQVSVGTTSEGVSYTLGTQYGWGKHTIEWRHCCCPVDIIRKSPHPVFCGTTSEHGWFPCDCSILFCLASDMVLRRYSPLCNVDWRYIRHRLLLYFCLRQRHWLLYTIYNNRL